VWPAEARRPRRAGGSGATRRAGKAGQRRRRRRLDDHRAERAAFVRQLLDKAGIQPAHAVEDGPFLWERTKSGDSDVPTRPALLLAAISQRQRWRADYLAAQLKAGELPPQDRSATDDQERRGVAA
jgi:hypothetical protein